ncbi:MAG: hypothetical protein ABJB12_23085 [Pseudomonadota bacterium]
MARHAVSASDELSALARALSGARREALAHPFSPSPREVVLESLIGAFARLAGNGCRGLALQHAPATAPPRTPNTQGRLLNSPLGES